jgi:predicted phosphoribosyltransferase
MGAIATGGVRVLNSDVTDTWGIPESVIEAVEATERRELARRERLYRGTRPPPDVRGKIVILVDDGLATGSTMLVAIRALQLQRPARIVVAVPTAAPSVCSQIGREVDEIICAIMPEPFHAVGLWYDDFSETTDDDVRMLLHQAARQATIGDGEHLYAWDGPNP